MPEKSEGAGQLLPGGVRGEWGSEAPRPLPGAVALPLGRRLLFGGGGSGDGQRLDRLVTLPLGWIITAYLLHEVRRPLPVALRVELDLSGDAVELGLADGGRDILAARQFAALRGGLDRLESHRGGVIGLSGVGLWVLTELLLELLHERLRLGQIRGGS